MRRSGKGRRTMKNHQMTIKPITFRQASEYVNRFHRHHKAPTGGKFSIGLCDGDKLVGVAICGRPVSRILDDGVTCEITRVCTDGTPNACSMLYGACCKIAKEMGYEKIITYILESDNGASLKASNFICEGKAGGLKWTGKRDTGAEYPHEMKTRWMKKLK